MHGAPSVPVKECHYTIGGVNVVLRSPITSFAPELLGEEFDSPLRDQVQKGLYGPVVTKEWKLQPKNVVVDIGGNLGLFSILMAKMHPGIRVLTYEADPQTAAFARSNVIANQVHNEVKVHNLALTGDGRMVQIFGCSKINSGRHGMFEDALSKSKPLAQGNNQMETCGPDDVHMQPSTTIASIISKHRLERIHVLKLDCEGCEFEVAPQLNMDMIARIVGECHRFSGHQPPPEVKAFCRRHQLHGI